LADSECGIDFTQYDNDEDGYVDFVFVIYAGYGEADGGASNTIWPHAWNLYSAAGIKCQVDGKTVDLYACGNELDYYSKMHTGIGTFCHEFSHVLGLPDLYVTNGGAHKTLGEWSILDYGPYGNEGNTPPTYSAYERFFMGWLTPRLIVDAENVKLEELKKSNEALLISTTDKHNLKGNDPNPTKFYLLENRQNAGWDAYLPGHGLMMTYVQYSSIKWRDNTVNNEASRMGVDLIEADGKEPDYYSNEYGYSGKPGDLFPAGAKQYMEIDNHEIEEIKEDNGIITFKYKGGVIETAIEDVASNEEVIAIYNVLGQKLTTHRIEDLTHGTYIVKTATGTKKIAL
jgi:M6 family metalloprotease-like protein